MAAVTGRVPLIAGNWKMNLDHLQAIAFVQKLISADKLPLKFGGQDVSAFDSGAYTGEISGAFLKALDCEYVIIGHSERRQYHHETDEEIGAKVAAAIKHGIVPVLCVGETAADLEEHGPSAVPVAQLTAALQGIEQGADLVVAYEPVWAIGSGTAATPEQAEQVAAALRVALGGLIGREAADATRILYGGSVKAANIAGFMRQPNVDGALVGGASLDLTEFSSIAQFQKHVGT